MSIEEMQFLPTITATFMSYFCPLCPLYYRVDVGAW